MQNTTSSKPFNEYVLYLHLQMEITLAFSPSVYPTYLSDHVPNLASYSVCLLVTLTNCGCLSRHNPLRHQSGNSPTALFFNLLELAMIHVDEPSQESGKCRAKMFLTNYCTFKIQLI